jgi:hypothetical protein
VETKTKELILAQNKFEWEKENSQRLQAAETKRAVILKLVEQKMSPGTIKKFVDTLEL